MTSALNWRVLASDEKYSDFKQCVSQTAHLCDQLWWPQSALAKNASSALKAPFLLQIFSDYSFTILSITVRKYPSSLASNLTWMISWC